MSRDEWEYGYDDTLDRILGQTTALLSQRGDQQAVALLLDVSSITIAQTDEVIRTVADEDWGGQPTTRSIYRRAATFDVDEHLIARYTDEVRERIAATLSYVAERNGEADVAYVQVRAALPEVDENWRDTYAERLTATPPTNQARRERDLPSYPVVDGLTFGSDEERRVYAALKRLQADFPEAETIALVPLPGVRLRAGHTWSPDIIVVGHGRAMVVEVDGPHHRNDRRYADDRNRDLQWQRCGVAVVRLSVEDLDDDAALERRLKEEILRHLPRG